jgi:hypothetical protein
MDVKTIGKEPAISCEHLQSSAAAFTDLQLFFTRLPSESLAVVLSIFHPL